MLFKQLNKNNLAILLLAPFILLGLWARLFFTEMVHISTPAPTFIPLWESYIMPWLMHSRQSAAAGSFMLALITGLSLNRITSKHGLLQNQSMTPFIIFSLLTGALLFAQKLSPAWFFACFFVLSLGRLFNASIDRNKTLRCFDSGCLLGLGCLIYPKGIFFFPMLLICMGILRIGSVKVIVGTLLGLLLPFAISFTYFFFFDQGKWFTEAFYQSLVANPGEFNHTTASQIYMGFIIAILTMSIIVSASFNYIQKTITKNFFRVFIWIILWTTAGVLTPFFSMEMVPIVSIGAAVTISFWLGTIKRQWIKELLFYLIVASTLFGQFFLS